MYFVNLKDIRDKKIIDHYTAGHSYSAKIAAEELFSVSNDFGLIKYGLTNISPVKRTSPRPM